MKHGAVAKYGSGLMNAINNMAIPGQALQRMIEPPQIHRFADGGQVPGASAGMTVPAVASRSQTNNFHFDGIGIKELFSESNVRRYLVPRLDAIQVGAGNRSPLLAMTSRLLVDLVAEVVARELVEETRAGIPFDAAPANKTIEPHEKSRSHLRKVFDREAGRAVSGRSAATLP